MKLKLPQLPGTMPRKKKLRARAGRGATVPASDFDDLSEPNMKLSRALLIVLVLHVVAVAGIIAFNAIKSRQGSFAASAGVSGGVTAKAAASPASTGTAVPTHHEDIKPGHAVSIAPRNERRVKSADSALPDGAKYYTVAKGDNPLTIAKKFKVPYDDLLAVNHIDDPRKLKIGQKLIIPARKGKKE